MRPVTIAAAICSTFLSLPVQSMMEAEVELVCPIGGKPFKTVTAISGTVFRKGLDLKPLGPTPAPWPLAKCPDNGFVIYKEEFSKEELNRLTPFVLSSAYQSLASKHTNYFLAAKLRSFQGEPVADLASTLLQATWEARDPAEYESYATEALIAYEALLATQPKDKNQALTATLLAGELERRLGLFEKARSRFTRIPEADKLQEPVGSMVKLQLELIEMRYRDAALIPVK